MKKLLIIALLFSNSIMNMENIAATGKYPNLGNNSVVMPRAYIYLTHTERDMDGLLNVTATLVVTENPRTAELEIYDVQDLEIEARNGELVYGVHVEYIAISSTKKGVEVYFSYYDSTGKNMTTVVYTI